MMNQRTFLFVFFYLIVAVGIYGQTIPTDSLPDDSKYREDQFYVGVTVNFLSGLPGDVEQSGFSGSARFGFLRDMPINEQRNLAIAIGAGLSFNTNNQNMKIEDKPGEATRFEQLADDAYESNRFSTYLAEIPLQIRWRTSTAKKNNFWRIYTGFKVGYLYSFKSKFKTEEQQIDVKDPDGLERWRYSLTLSAGYGKVNFYLDYSLNNLFSGVSLEDRSLAVNIQPIKAGFIFYIL